MPFVDRRHRGLPHFLHDICTDLSDDERVELKAIYSNEALTKQQIRDQVKAFFNKIGGDPKAKFSQAEEKMMTCKAEKEAKWTEKQATFTPEARAYLSKVKNIKDDMSLTHSQEHEQIQKLFDSLDERVKNEIKSLFEGHREHHPHRGHHKRHNS